MLSWRFGRPLLAALSGLLLFLSFPKFGHGLVAWVALVPVLVALHGVGPGRAFRLGHLFGTVGHVGLLYWTALVVVQFGGLPMAVAVPLMVLLAATVALFPAAWAWAVARLCGRLGPAGLLLAPVPWVATEVVRNYTFFHFPWCLLGYSQHELLSVVQLASLGGVFLVSFVVAGGSSLLAYLAVEPRPSARRRAALAGLAALAGVLAFGAWRLATPVATQGSLRVGLVQASIRQDEKWVPGLAERNVLRHVRLSREAAAQGARFVIWPESSVPWPYDEEPVLADQLQTLARGLRAYLLFGNDDVDEGTQPRRIYVGAKLLDPEGRLAYRHHKLRLVPFGEYVPMGPLLTLGGRFTARLVAQVGQFTPGETYEVGRVEGHGFATLVCYEVIFPELSRRFASEGARLLVSVTNDGWYGSTSAPYQHLMMARFRPVETGRYLVRAANTGISAVVDPRGRLLASTALFEERALVADVPVSSEDTPYLALGEAFGLLCLAGALALAAWARPRPEGQGAGLEVE